MKIQLHPSCPQGAKLVEMAVMLMHLQGGGNISNCLALRPKLLNLKEEVQLYPLPFLWHYSQLDESGQHF